MKHILAPGKAVIDGLERLGSALGYEVRREHRVGRNAAVDLSWNAAEFNDVPLFVFEVESTPSAGLANNATKVFGSSLDELPRPLFFFHLVLAGNPDNARIKNAERSWGQHNYRVYRFHAPDDRRRLVVDVLEQHRRVCQAVRPRSVVDALQGPGFDDFSIAEAALTRMEELRFVAPYLLDYGMLALRDERFFPLYVRRLRAVDRHPATPCAARPVPAGATSEIEDGYLDAPGSYIPGLLESALRIYGGDVLDSEGPELLERWATSGGPHMRMIDAPFGLNRDYDQFVLISAPFHYVWAAIALEEHPKSRAWVLNDLMELVKREHDKGIHGPVSWPAIIWMAHLLAGRPALDCPLNVESMYRELQRIVDEIGGIPLALLLDPPPPYGELWGGDDMGWIDAEGAGELPAIHRLGEAVGARLRVRDQQLDAADDGLGAAPMGFWRTCLSALLADDAYLRPTRDVLRDVYDLDRHTE
ncbi:hypothetical protein [Oceanitalea stevensii]|uniref:DUF4365 domain-containing protein n=1 Tax=Oceanitalea stevensii TaxID=2763072 RepID=A0ABR8Z660_9MICO|nr:hypothetical protein [Oceanitalea stevensii]MBD8063744.1 hypothetical protein [Oceanitalea stevensii]